MSAKRFGIQVAVAGGVKLGGEIGANDGERTEAPDGRRPRRDTLVACAIVGLDRCPLEICSRIVLRLPR